MYEYQSTSPSEISFSSNHIACSPRGQLGGVGSERNEPLVSNCQPTIEFRWHIHPWGMYGKAQLTDWNQFCCNYHFSNPICRPHAYLRTQLHTKKQIITMQPLRKRRERQLSIAALDWGVVSTVWPITVQVVGNKASQTI